jgi:hypothetical protein
MSRARISTASSMSNCIWRTREHDTQGGVNALRLVGSLYGLKQSGRTSWIKPGKALETLSFKRTESDWGLYYRTRSRDRGPQPSSLLTATLTPRHHAIPSLGRLLTVLLQTFLASSTFSAFRLLSRPGRRRRSFRINTPPPCRTCSQRPAASGCHTHSPGRHRRGRHSRHRRDLRCSSDSLLARLLCIRGSQRTKHGHRVGT